MADVEIKYNNSTIASLSDSGTEVFETSGMFLIDDITVKYTKSGGGGGGGSTTVSVSDFTGNIYYIDSADGTLKYKTLDAVNQETWTGSVPSGSMVVLHWSVYPVNHTHTNLTLVYDVNNGLKATYKRTEFYVAD